MTARKYTDEEIREEISHWRSVPGHNIADRMILQLLEEKKKLETENEMLVKVLTKQGQITITTSHDPT